MPAYNYSAMNEIGRKIRGVITADNELDLESRLKQVGLDLVDARVVKEKRSSRFSRIKLKDLIMMCVHLEQLIRAGVPLHDALADVRDSSESPKLRDIMTGVYESVKNGNVLSKSLAAYPKVFGEVFSGLIAAGEKTGDLSESFHHLTEHMKWTADIKRKIKKATRYPVVLLIVMSLVIGVLMVAVVPKLVTFILSQGFAIPIHTRALIATSNAFVNYWYLILGLPVLAVIALLAFYRVSPGFAYQVDAFMLRVPVIGPTVRKIDMARFTHFFSVMFNSGIDILDSLQGAGNVVGNRVLKETVNFVRETVTEGNSLTSALRMSNQFPNLVIRMFKVGEDSGNMKEALDNINFFYTREVNDSVDGMIGMIQPALTVVMGILIFWVIAAVFGPLYESFSKMKF
jgi:type IV pilus assembly protein PilC